MTTWFSASAVVPQLRSEWGIGSAGAAAMTLAVQLGFVVGAVLAAVTNLADVVPAPRLILYGAVGAASVNAGVAFAGGLATALPLRFLTGAFLAGVYPSALKQMSTWFRAGRGTALGVMVGALTLGSAVPHLVNGLGGANWRVVVLSTSALTLAGAATARWLVAPGPFPFPQAQFDPRQVGRILRNRGVRLASLGYFGHMWELYAMWAWFVVFAADALRDRGQSDPQTKAAVLTFAVIGVGAAGCWLGGILGDRWGRTTLTIAAMTTSGSCAVVIGWLDGAPLVVFLAVALLWGFTVVADSAQFSTMVTEIGDQRYVGTALTLQLAAGFSLTGLTIVLVPLVRDVLGWHWAFVVLAPGPFLGVWAMWRLRGSPDAAKIAGGRG
jgi:MFS family permease